jgi:hypothetical protein
MDSDARFLDKDRGGIFIPLAAEKAEDESGVGRVESWGSLRLMAHGGLLRPTRRWDRIGLRR